MQGRIRIGIRDQSVHPIRVEEFVSNDDVGTSVCRSVHRGEFARPHVTVHALQEESHTVARLERAVLLSPGKELRIPLSELKSSLSMSKGEAPEAASSDSVEASPAQVATLEEAERQHILRVLRQTKWRIAGPRGAAVLLGMKRTTLQARIRKLGIRRPI